MKMNNFIKQNLSEINLKEFRTYIGIFLLLVWIISFSIQFYYEKYYLFFWFCYIAISLSGIGFLLNKANLVYTFLSIAIIVQIPYGIDLLLIYLGKAQLIGLVNYNPLELTLIQNLPSILIHFIPLPVSLIGLKFIKEKNPTYIFSLIFIITILIISFFLPVKVNCVEIGCFNSIFGDTNMFQNLIILSLIIIVSLILQPLFFKLNKYLRNI